MNARPQLALMLAALGSMGNTCGDTGQRFVTFDMFAQGRGDATLTLDDVEVTLTRAELALGPIYFCATTAADADLCPVAVAELREIEVVDLLANEPTRLGTVEATTGMVRSATLEYGRPWLLTESRARPGPGALSGHSARLEGQARRGEQVLSFAVDLDLTPRHAGDSTVPGLDAEFAVIEGAQSLHAQVDPSAWIRSVDFGALLDEADADDAIELEIEPGSQAYSAIVIAMSNGAPPEISWSEEETP